MAVFGELLLRQNFAVCYSIGRFNDLVTGKLGEVKIV